MTFSFTREIADVSGKKYVNGTYANDGGSTGGDIDTGLANVESMILQPFGSVSGGEQSPLVNESLPLSNPNVTIVTDANQSGSWMATGI